MKGFPNQVADLAKLATAMQCIADLVDNGQQAKDDGSLGEELVRARVAGTGHSPQPIEDYIRSQLHKRQDRQSFRTTARGLRELFRILGFIDDTGETVHIAELGRQAAAFANRPMNEAQITFWRRVIRNMSHDGGDGAESHPYQVLLRLIARNPGLEKSKCALALEARNDSPEELTRIVNLAHLPEQRIISGLRVSRRGRPLTQSDWANAVKVLPKFAEQLEDVVRTGTRGGYQYSIADAPGREDLVLLPPQPLLAQQQDGRQEGEPPQGEQRLVRHAHHGPLRHKPSAKLEHWTNLTRRRSSHRPIQPLRSGHAATDYDDTI